MQYMHLGSNFIVMMNEIRYILAVMDNTVHQHTDGFSGSMLVALFTIVAFGLHKFIDLMLYFFQLYGIINSHSVTELDQVIIMPFIHILQGGAAGMALYVGYRTIKKMDNK